MPLFQTNMLAVREHRSINYQINYRHELCPFLCSTFKNKNITDRNLKFHEVLAVAGHHKTLDVMYKSLNVRYTQMKNQLYTRMH